MSDVLLPIQSGNLPPNYCFTGWQKLLVDFAAVMFAKISGQSYYNVGATKPAVQFQAYPWLNTTDGRWYQFSGQWISPHPWQYATSLGLRLEWEGTEADLKLFDGGDAGALSSVSGPMWEIDHNYDGRSSMGPGTIPTSNPSKVLAVTEDFGEGAHQMTIEEVGPHIHPLQTEASITNAGGTIDVVNTGVGGPGLQIGLTGVATNVLEVLANTYATTQQNMPVIHPVRGCYKIRRTTRIYYAVP